MRSSVNLASSNRAQRGRWELLSAPALLTTQRHELTRLLQKQACSQPRGPSLPSSSGGSRRLLDLVRMAAGRLWVK